MQAAYPAYRESDLVLRDGSTVRVRPVRLDDAPRIAALYRGMSTE